MTVTLCLQPDEAALVQRKMAETAAETTGAERRTAERVRRKIEWARQEEQA